VRERTLSPVEVVEAHLKRIEQLNPKLNAVVTPAPDAIERAKSAETAVARSDSLGALHGIPLTIKDTIDTEGLRTTSGSRLREHHVPRRDAPAVARLKAAGAIILGKTNTAEMAMDYTADNPVFGRTNNPYDQSRVPGGSSGGEAAAIAACMSPGGIGSDLAGSIRIPAHCCGIVGLKPTTTSVPSQGQFPAAIGPYSLGAAIGPLARSVEDVQILFRVLAGSETSTGVVKIQRGLRVAWYSDDGVAPVTEETRKAVEAAARALADAGFVVEERRPPAVECGHDLWLKLFSRASVALLREVYAGRENEGGDFVRWRLQTADDDPKATLNDYLTAWLERDRLRETLIEWMDATPLILAPVGATPAWEHNAHKVNVNGTTLSTFRAFSYAQTCNVFDLPSVAVPAGRSSDELPIGVQVIARPFAEETALAAARIVEEALGGWQPPELE
jgi:Asp-tRNA(Asn)/Glu-tRNA(Gln) amidotransferase A subunit family amidase